MEPENPRAWADPPPSAYTSVASPSASNKPGPPRPCHRRDDTAGAAPPWPTSSSCAWSPLSWGAGAPEPAVASPPISSAGGGGTGASPAPAAAASVCADRGLDGDRWPPSTPMLANSELLSSYVFRSSARSASMAAPDTSSLASTMGAAAAGAGPSRSDCEGPLSLSNRPPAPTIAERCGEVPNRPSLPAFAVPAAAPVTFSTAPPGPSASNKDVPIAGVAPDGELIVHNAVGQRAARDPRQPGGWRHNPPKSAHEGGDTDAPTALAASAYSSSTQARRRSLHRSSSRDLQARRDGRSHRRGCDYS